MPPLNFPDHKSEHVLVPVSGTVSTQLDCDIQPGAAPENYDIAWFRLNSHGGSARVREGISQETFNLTLQVNLSNKYV